MVDLQKYHLTSMGDHLGWPIWGHNPILWSTKQYEQNFVGKLLQCVTPSGSHFWDQNPFSGSTKRYEKNVLASTQVGDPFRKSFLRSKPIFGSTKQDMKKMFWLVLEWVTSFRNHFRSQIRFLKWTKWDTEKKLVGNTRVGDPYRKSFLGSKPIFGVN